MSIFVFEREAGPYLSHLCQKRGFEEGWQGVTRMLRVQHSRQHLCTSSASMEPGAQIG